MAYLFNGTSDAFSLADFSTSDAFTIAAKMKWASLTSDDTSAFASDNFPSTPRYTALTPYYTSSGGNKWILEARVNGTGGSTNTAATPSTGVWYSLVLDRSNTVARGFVDNVQIGSNITVASGTMNFKNPRIAAHFFNSVNNQFGNVTVAEVGIWSAQLDINERDALKSGISPLLIRPASLLKYIPLLGTAIDLVGGETLGTISGPALAAHVGVFMSKPVGAAQR